MQHFVLRERLPVEQRLGQFVGILLVRLDEFVRPPVGGFEQAVDLDRETLTKDEVLQLITPANVAVPASEALN